MPLVEAKCTSCGSVLKVDNSKDAAICEHCKTPFIVEKAVQIFQNTTNLSISNANINVSGIDVPSIEKLADSSFIDSNYDDAYIYYSKLVEVDPQNKKWLTRRSVAKGGLSNIKDYHIETAISSLVRYATEIEATNEPDYKELSFLLEKIHNIAISLFVLNKKKYDGDRNRASGTVFFNFKYQLVKDYDKLKIIKHNPNTEKILLIILDDIIYFSSEYAKRHGFDDDHYYEYWKHVKQIYDSAQQLKSLINPDYQVAKLHREMSIEAKFVLYVFITFALSVSLFSCAYAMR